MTALLEEGLQHDFLLARTESDMVLKTILLESGLEGVQELRAELHTGDIGRLVLEGLELIAWK